MPRLQGIIAFRLMILAYMCTHLHATCSPVAGDWQIGILKGEKFRLARVEHNLIASGDHAATRIKDRSREQHLEFTPILTR
jgi:hypothetical protein